jgi:ubiquinol-cytochrome c reductase cytochrome b subunit
MDAWTADAVPVKYLHDRTPLERQGAMVLQDKQCRNCHSLAGAGGQRGPALDAIAARMTEDQIIRQVLQGGGNMPAYGNALNPSETKGAGQLPDDLERQRPYPRDRCVANPGKHQRNARPG